MLISIRPVRNGNADLIFFDVRQASFLLLKTEIILIGSVWRLKEKEKKSAQKSAPDLIQVRHPLGLDEHLGFLGQQQIQPS